MGRLILLGVFLAWSSAHAVTWRDACARMRERDPAVYSFHAKFLATICKEDEARVEGLIVAELGAEKYLNAIALLYPQSRVVALRNSLLDLRRETQLDYLGWNGIPRAEIFLRAAYHALQGFCEGQWELFTIAERAKLTPVLQSDPETLARTVAQLLPAMATRSLLRAQADTVADWVKFVLPTRVPNYAVRTERSAVARLSLDELRARLQTNAACFEKDLHGFTDIFRFAREIAPDVQEPAAALLRRIGALSPPAVDAELVGAFASNVFYRMMTVWRIPLIDSRAREKIMSAAATIECHDRRIATFGPESFPLVPLFVRPAVEILGAMRELAPFTPVARVPALLAIAGTLETFAPLTDDALEDVAWSTRFPTAAFDTQATAMQNEFWMGSTARGLRSLANFLLARETEGGR